MARPDGSFDRPVQPAISELLAGYLRQQISRQAAGLAGVESTGEVVPFDAIPVQPVDAALAWSEAVAVALHFQPESQTPTWPVPPDWAAMVSSQEPVAALALSFGNYPQMVRSLHTLLHATDLRALLPAGEASAPPAPGVREWAAASTRGRPFPQVLLAVGVLRLNRQFDAAAELLERHKAEAPSPWQAAWANEEAALAWHQGRVQEAANLWQKQAASLPVLFNRGMAALFLGNSAEARPVLTEAVEQLPEESGWSHLGRLYLVLAEML
jgi:tetratricopeptide (TPR) repeat protein